VESIQLQLLSKLQMYISRQPGYHIVTFQSRQNQPVPMAYPGKSKNEKDAKKSKKNDAVASTPALMNASIQYPVQAVKAQTQPQTKRESS
jgi:hypothetical protein